MESKGIRHARIVASVIVALLVLGLMAPLAAAAKKTDPPSGNGGLGDPSADSTVPQIPPRAKVFAVRAWIERAIALRLNALHRADAKSSGWSALTASDRSAFLDVISADSAGLSSLASSVRSDTTVTQLQGVIGAMITEYRVFDVLVPQVTAARRLDSSATTVAGLAKTEFQIAAAVTTASALGESKAILRLYAALVTEVSSAESLVALNHAAVVNLVPASFSRSAAVFVSAQSAMATIRGDVNAAKSDIEKIAVLLRERLNSPTLSAPDIPKTKSPVTGVTLPSVSSLPA
ncbi:MAG: hypothetical protein WB770_01875 [Acidimicrobiales bacterium]